MEDRMNAIISDRDLSEPERQSELTKLLQDTEQAMANAGVTFQSLASAQLLRLL